MKRFKLIIAASFVVAIVSAVVTQSFAYPPFLAKAKKFGAKDCTFCHVAPEGGAPWNARGQWLIKEKERRGADSIDVEWLAEYKEGSGDVKKPAEVKPAETRPAETPTKAIKVDTKVLDTYTGQYEAPFGVLTISRDGDKLFGAPEGQEKAELVAISETEFDVPSVGVKVKFVKDDSGKVTHMVLNHDGEEIQAKKIK
ncbi:MAG TPA: DUF3471 domain-containing protein [Blastocatellia bacterium]|nr:DUF3471 domain-containing protein [Blastocatellia bacterium]